MPRRHLRLMRACVRMGCGGPCSAPLPDLKTLHQSRSLRNAATTATGRLRAGVRFSPLTPGGKAGGWARKSAARQYVGKNRSRRFPQAPRRPFLGQADASQQEQAERVPGPSGKSALHQLFLLSVFEKRPRCGFAVVCRRQRVAGRWTQRRCVPTFLGKAVLLGSAGMFYGAGLRAGRAVAANLARTGAG